MIRLTILAGIATVLMLSSAQADATRSTSCIHNRGALSCVTNWQHWDPQIPQPPTEQEIAESRERERVWQARCRPTVWQDDFGVRRYAYATYGCEYGRLN